MRVNKFSYNINSLIRLPLKEQAKYADPIAKRFSRNESFLKKQFNDVKIDVSKWNATSVGNLAFIALYGAPNYRQHALNILIRAKKIVLSQAMFIKRICGLNFQQLNSLLRNRNLSPFQREMVRKRIRNTIYERQLDSRLKMQLAMVKKQHLEQPYLIVNMTDFEEYPINYGPDDPINKRLKPVTQSMMDDSMMSSLMSDPINRRLENDRFNNDICSSSLIRSKIEKPYLRRSY